MQIPPANLQLQPSTKLVFNAPFDEAVTYYFKVTNTGERRIAFIATPSNAQRLSVAPNGRVLDPKEAARVGITCHPFKFVAGAAGSDMVTVEWVNALNESGKEFKKETHFPVGVGAATRRQDIAIEYNG